MHRILLASALLGWTSGCLSSTCDEPPRVETKIHAVVSSMVAMEDVEVPIEVAVFRSVDAPPGEHTSCTHVPEDRARVSIERAGEAATRLEHRGVGVFTTTLRGYSDRYVVRVSADGSVSETKELPEFFTVFFSDLPGPDGLTVSWWPRLETRVEAFVSVKRLGEDEVTWDSSQLGRADTGSVAIPGSAFAQPDTYRITVDRRLFDYPHSGVLEVYTDLTL
jgi:hypothetical protein